MTPTGVEHGFHGVGRQTSREVNPSMTPTGVEHSSVDRIVSALAVRESFYDADRR